MIAGLPRQAEQTDSRPWEERRQAGEELPLLLCSLWLRSGSGIVSIFPLWLEHLFSILQVFLAGCDIVPMWAETSHTWREVLGLSPPPPLWKQTRGACSHPSASALLIAVSTSGCWYSTSSSPT